MAINEKYWKDFENRYYIIKQNCPDSYKELEMLKALYETILSAQNEFQTKILEEIGKTEID